jgi:hypothetical protein
MNEPIKKRRNKYWKIADLMQSEFTDANGVVIVSSSCHSKAGICNPREASKGRFLQRFFCTHQNHRCILLWWGVTSNPLKGWPDLAGIANLIHPTAQRFATMGGGLSLLQGIPQ